MICTLENSGLSVRAEFRDADVEGIFMPMLRRLTRMRREKGGRVVALLAAPPAAGKSTLAALLRLLSTREAGLCPLTVIAMDGFHHTQGYLRAHRIERGGEAVPLASIKGAPPTFDLEKLRERLSRVAAGERCGWPAYDRTIHDPVEDAVRVEGETVLLEGNYLLLDVDGWRELRGMADYTVSITAPPEMLYGRLVARHIAGGKTPEEARDKAERSDMANVRLCLERSLPADLTLALGEDGGFEALG